MLKQIPTWLWPITVLLSTGATALVIFVTHGFMQPIFVIWFLFVCPGKAFVPLLRIKDTAAEWMLVIGLSTALSGGVATFQIYGHLWSPTITFLILMFITLFGLALQLLQYALL